MLRILSHPISRFPTVFFHEFHAGGAHRFDRCRAQDSATGAVADLGTTGTPALTLIWACGYKIPSSPTKVGAKYLPATCR